MHNRRPQILALALAAVLIGCTSSPSHDVTGEDLEKMKLAARAYSEAWLSNDPDAVMATFVSEPVLSPSGLPFLEGQADAREFWWPEGSPPAMVTQFEYEELEAAGSGDIGYVRGVYTLGFEYGGKSHTNVGKFLHVLKRTSGGEWRISHHFWNDLPPDGEH